MDDTHEVLIHLWAPLVKGNAERAKARLDESLNGEPFDWGANWPASEDLVRYDVDEEC